MELTLEFPAKEGVDGLGVDQANAGGFTEFEALRA